MESSKNQSVINESPTSIKGLTTAEALSRLKKYGPNTFPRSKPPSAWSILISQFKSPLIYIILVAAVISLIMGELTDFIIIIAVVIVDVILGFFQEFQAQRTYTALNKLLKPTTTVIRDGERQEIDVTKVVPGDIVILNAGERIPGDGEIIEGARLSVDEAILTGESEPIKKSVEAGSNQVFMGTTLLTGRGVMRVTQTGVRTELGKIAKSLQEHKEEETPLQVRLKSFSRTLTIIVVSFTTIIFLVGLLLKRDFLDMLRTSVILAISAIPEGLLIAVTVILVLGMRKILKRQGLVKKLLAVETLGSVNVICTDKTGTLTEGRMRVTRTDFVDNERAIQIMVLCNNLEGPVEMALWEYAKSRLPNDPQTLVEESQRLDEEMFTSETKFMITGHHLPDGDYHFLKGAPEIVLNMCQINDGERQRILARIDQWAGEGLRLLGLAYRDYGILEDHTGYRWVGLIGMEDPIREGVHEAVLLAKHAGIQVKMITGDYRRTAERIASNIGLLQNGEETLEGEELAQLNDEELAKRIYPTAVFARIRPHDKLRIVNTLQKNGDITAMIGDGVNDAPALKQANIGVVVGTASDVAKETADLILLDNNFRTIVAAIEEGRVIFENIRKVVAYVLSNSFAEVLTIFISMILGWPAPLLVAQILWIHLICDGPADIVLGFEPKENGIMDEKPKSLKEPILPPLGLFLIGVISIGSALAALLIFRHYFKIHGDPVEGRSLVFASLAINSLIYIFAYRSMRKSLFKMNSILKNKPLIFAVIFGMVLVFLPFVIPSLSQVLGVVPLDLKQWLLIFTIALMLLIAVEIGKAVSNWWRDKQNTLGKG